MSIIKKTSLKDIAAKAGVSPALVSFVLNGKGREHRVGEQTIKHVIKVAEEMNYQPNVAAKSLRSGKSRALGVVLSDISNPFFAQTARGIEDAAAKRGYTVLFGSSDEYAPKMDLVVSSLLNRSVDGLIIVPCEGSEDTIRELVRNDVPIVLFDRPMRDMNVSSVSMNNYAASHKAVLHLIGSGFKKVGMIAYDIELAHMQDRVRGYSDAMEESGKKSDITIGYVKISDPYKMARKIIPRLIDSGVDALFLATNTISLACLHAIKEIGIKIPGQMGILGFDGNDAFNLFYSPISYVEQPIPTLANKVVEVMIEKLENRMALVNNVQIEGKLVIRDSSLRR